MANGGRRNVLGLQLLAWVRVLDVGHIQQALDYSIVGVGVFGRQDGNVLIDVGRVSNITLRGISGTTMMTGRSGDGNSQRGQ